MPSIKAERLEFGLGLNGGDSIASAKALRVACYDILGTMREEQDRMVKRILAGLAFRLAQQAQLTDAGEGEAK